MNGLARHAIEIRDLIERFSSLSGDALRACTGGDTLSLAATLDARDLVGKRLSTLTAQVVATRNGLPKHLQGPADALLEPVSRTAQHAAGLNAQLLMHATNARLGIAQEIERLGRDSEASSAYQNPDGRGTGRLDALR